MSGSLPGLSKFPFKYHKATSTDPDLGDGDDQRNLIAMQSIQDHNTRSDGRTEMSPHSDKYGSPPQQDWSATSPTYQQPWVDPTRQQQSWTDPTQPQQQHQQQQWRDPTQQYNTPQAPWDTPSARLLESGGQTQQQGYYSQADRDALLERTTQPITTTQSKDDVYDPQNSAHRRTASNPEITYTDDRGSQRRGSFSQMSLNRRSFQPRTTFKSPIIGSTPKSPAVKLQPHEIIQQRANLTATWGIHWYLPTMMVGIFIAGIIGAVGHHAFYKSLHRSMSEGQLMKVRIGTAFAFFVKACLVGAVVLAYRQRIWYTLRRRPMKIKTIDAVFGVIEDPTFFFISAEMWKGAKVSTIMALCTWLIPIASVLSPSSLTSEVSLTRHNGTCKVQMLDFSKELLYDFRTAKDNFGNSLAFYNYTDPNDPEGSEIAYDSPSFINRKLGSLSIYNSEAIGPPTSPCRGYNCTFSFYMDGPGYKCEDIDDVPGLRERAPFNESVLAPGGDFIYYSNLDQGDFQKPDLPRSEDYDPNWIPGVFYFEPELWFGYVINTTVPLPKDHEYYEIVKGERLPRWTHVLEQKLFHCTHYHVTYDLQVDWVNDRQNVTVRGVEYKKPVVPTVFRSEDEPPPDMSVVPRPGKEGYKVVVVYHAVGQLMRNFLRGNIEQSNNRFGTFPLTTTDMSMTNLVNQTDSFTNPRLMHAIQRFHQDILFTYWSYPNLVISKEDSIPCERRRFENLFNYYEKNLWIGYSLAVAVTLVSIIIGGFSMNSNGICSDTLFSRILVTTRNPTLDRLSKGACLGSDPFPPELENTKLRFGVLNEDYDAGTGLGLNVPGLPSGNSGQPGHCAFGTVHETTDIINGQPYAGLGDVEDIVARKPRRTETPRHLYSEKDHQMFDFEYDDEAHDEKFYDAISDGESEAVPLLS